MLTTEDVSRICFVAHTHKPKTRKKTNHKPTTVWFCLFEDSEVSLPRQEGASGDDRVQERVDRGTQEELGDRHERRWT